MDRVFAEERAFAVALFGDAQQALPAAGAARTYNIVALSQFYAPHAHGGAAHGPHVLFAEAAGHAVSGGDEDVLIPGGLEHGDELVPLFQGQGPYAAGADVFQGGLLHALDGAVSGDEEEIAVLLHAPAPYHGADLFPVLPGVYRYDVDDIGASGVASGLGDGVALFQEDPALAGEEEDEVMGGGGEHRVHIVLLLGGHGPDALAAPALAAVLAHGQALDIAAVGEGEDALFLFDKVFHVYLVGHVLYLGLSLVAVLVPDGGQLLFQHGLYLLRVGQELPVIAYLLLQLLVLRLQLFPVQALEGDKAHVADGLGLDLAEAEAFHEPLLCVVITGADDADDLVYIVLGYQQSLQQMGPLLRLSQVVPGAADDELFLELQVLAQDVLQREYPGLALIVHQGQHVYGKAALHGGLGEEAVEHHLGICVPLQLYDHAHAVAVGLVPQVGYALQALVVDLVGDVLYQLPLVHLVGQLRDYYAYAVLAVLLKLGAGPHYHLAPAGGVGLAYAAAAHDDAPGGEVRPGDVLHQLRKPRLRVFQQADAGVYHFPEIVGRDIGGHAHGDAAAAVDQEIGEAGGQDPGLFPCLVEVWVPVHGVLVDIPEHLVGYFGEPCLGVAVGCRGVSVHGAEVAVAVHQHVAHGEVLGQTHHGVVDRAVSVGVVAAQHVAHAGGGLFEGLVGGEVILVQGVEYPPVYRLQTVPHVGEGPAHDDAHGVIYIAGLHLADQFRLGYGLIGKGDILRLVVSLVCHFPSPPQISRLATYLALRSIQSRRGSTSSPMSTVNISSAFSASLRVIRRRVRFSGSMVVSHSSWGSISPRPLKREMSTFALGLSALSWALSLSLSSSE